MFGEGEEMYLQGSEIWHPHCSEEFQRENEEMERLNASQSQDGPPSPTADLRVHVKTEGHHEPQLESPTAGNGIDRFNGHHNGHTEYNHNRQPSNSSEGKETKPNTWKPSSSNTTSNTPSYQKPTGFRSVKPPQPVQNNPRDVSDDDEPPPVPPPPSRSSSSAWKQKYSQPSRTSTVSSIIIYKILFRNKKYNNIFNSLHGGVTLWQQNTKLNIFQS